MLKILMSAITTVVFLCFILLLCVLYVCSDVMAWEQGPTALSLNFALLENCRKIILFVTKSCQIWI